MPTINWREVNPYDLVQVSKILSGKLTIDSKDKPKTDLKKGSLFNFTKNKKSKK
jgi:hypothetical protein